MPSITVIKSIGIIVFSFIIGLLYYYSQAHDRTRAKKNVEEATSIIINFVIYLWLGKIIVHLPKFIEDPLAILAYPSNSAAFYLASLFTLINLMINIRKNKHAFEEYLVSLVSIVLVSAFVYEFSLIVQASSFEIYHFILLLGLILFDLFVKLDEVSKSFYLVQIWASGQIILSFIQPFTTMFGYTVHSAYFIIILIGSFVLKQKKDV